MLTDMKRGEAPPLDLLSFAALLALAMAETVFGTVTSPRWQQALVSLLWTAPIPWRRRYPVVVLAMVMAAGPVMPLVNEGGGLLSYVLSGVLAAFTAGRLLRGRARWWGLGLTVVLPWIYYALTDGILTDYEFTAIIYGGAWTAGYLVGLRDENVEDLTETTQELRSEIVERERRAIETERSRIARELHDIISHSISAVVIQTQAVRLRLGPDRGQEIDELRAVETTARQAMNEMRHLLGVLRVQTGHGDLSPQPGLAQLDRLVADMRAAGLDIDVIVDPVPPLPPGVDLAAYRIVQESLTNVAKHAPQAHTDVRVGVDDGLRIVVENGPSAGVSVLSDGPGHGLIGMRERVWLYEGTYEARPRGDGGFLVDVSLPIGTSAVR